MGRKANSPEDFIRSLIHQGLGRKQILDKCQNKDTSFINLVTDILNHTTLIEKIEDQVSNNNQAYINFENSSYSSKTLRAQMEERYKKKAYDKGKSNLPVHTDIEMNDLEAPLKINYPPVEDTSSSKKNTFNKKDNQMSLNFDNSKEETKNLSLTQNQSQPRVTKKDQFSDTEITNLVLSGKLKDIQISKGEITENNSTLKHSQIQSENQKLDESTDKIETPSLNNQVKHKDMVLKEIAAIKSKSSKNDSEKTAVFQSTKTPPISSLSTLKENEKEGNSPSPYTKLNKDELLTCLKRKDLQIKEINRTLGNKEIEMHGTQTYQEDCRKKMKSEINSLKKRNLIFQFSLGAAAIFVVSSLFYKYNNQNNKEKLVHFNIDEFSSIEIPAINDLTDNSSPIYQKPAKPREHLKPTDFITPSIHTADRNRKVTNSPNPNSDHYINNGVIPVDDNKMNLTKDELKPQSLPIIKHKVKNNESLWRIAAKHYGRNKGHYYKHIIKKNGLSNATLKKNQILLIPDLAEIEAEQ